MDAMNDGNEIKCSLRLTGGALEIAREFVRANDRVLAEGQEMRARQMAELEAFSADSKSNLDAIWQKLISAAGWQGRENARLDVRYLVSHGMVFLVEYVPENKNQETEA